MHCNIAAKRFHTGRMILASSTYLRSKYAAIFPRPAQGKILGKQRSHKPQSGERNDERVKEEKIDCMMRELRSA